jgi:hypothetical protein
MVAGKAGAISLGWEGLPGTDTLAYNENPKIMAAKSFIGLAPPGADLIKYFFVKIFPFFDKPDRFTILKDFTSNPE